MKKIHTKAKTVAVSIVAAVSSVAALCFLMATAGTAIAQGGGSRGTPPMPVERRTEVMSRQAGDYEIEKSSRDLKGPKDPAARRRVQEIAEQIKHDFAGLQESHNQLVLFMADKEGLDRQHDSIFRAVAEIKKYSTRLKTNLALPKPQQQQKARLGIKNDQIEESLMSLRKHIYDFVTNPLFESPGVLDLEQGRKASGDLDRILELSESITKGGDKLKKPIKP